MARLITVDDEEPEPAEPPQDSAVDEGYPTLNVKHSFALALNCYPIVSQLASYVDQTTLHELSRTCRQFRSNLLQYRQQLISQTLRCAYDGATPASKLGNAFLGSLDAWLSPSQQGMRPDRLVSGTVSRCARDLVSECRKCGTVVCRNCITKPPARPVLQGRHRRLCRTCTKAPLARLTSQHPLEDDYFEDVFTIARSPCTCADAVWICQPCGSSVRTQDTTYMRGWSWRTRYSTCGGFGTGLGEGVEGVECGRGAACLENRTVEKEVACGAQEMAAIEAEIEQAKLDGHTWTGTSYASQEIIGIGGQFKLKIKKQVVVGAVVKELEDERTDGEYLARERAGKSRSWCSWCNRVIPSIKDCDPSNASDSDTTPIS